MTDLETNKIDDIEEFYKHWPEIGTIPEPLKKAIFGFAQGWRQVAHSQERQITGTVPDPMNPANLKVNAGLVSTFWKGYCEMYKVNEGATVPDWWGFEWAAYALARYEKLGMEQASSEEPKTFDELWDQVPKAEPEFCEANKPILKYWFDLGAKSRPAAREHAADLLREACYLLRSAWGYVPIEHRLSEEIRIFFNGEAMRKAKGQSVFETFDPHLVGDAADAILRALRQFDHADRSEGMALKLIYFGNVRRILEEYVELAKKRI